MCLFSAEVNLSVCIDNLFYFYLYAFVVVCSVKQLAELESKHPSYLTDSDSDVSSMQA
jgi:hypothetical protein